MPCSLQRQVINEADIHFLNITYWLFDQYQHLSVGGKVLKHLLGASLSGYFSRRIERIVVNGSILEVLMKVFEETASKEAVKDTL